MRLVCMCLYVLRVTAVCALRAGLAANWLIAQGWVIAWSFDQLYGWHDWAWRRRRLGADYGTAFLLCSHWLSSSVFKRQFLSLLSVCRGPQPRSTWSPPAPIRSRAPTRPTGG
eukprot:SAG22_NODE_1468_length_4349_cov_2.069882_5_plen_113_part_00